ncbi:MAG: hypothetical protein K1X64_14290 [Myxococcaceae bacterium]|nr:hypothetical protein [Myxococcaceae bacterium]
MAPIRGNGSRPNIARTRVLALATRLQKAKSGAPPNPLREVGQGAQAVAWSQRSEVTPKAKAATQARAFLKPGAQLTIDGVTDPNQAFGQVRDFLAAQLGRDPRGLEVTRGPGRNRDPVYLVRDKGEAIGVFKIFVEPKLADVEVMLLNEFKKVRSLVPVEVRGTAEVMWNGTAQRGVFMEMVDRHSAGRQLTQLPPAGPKRAAGLKLAEKDIALIGAGLGDFHQQFASGREFSASVKKDIIAGLANAPAGSKSKFTQALEKWPGLKPELGPILERFKTELFPRFEKARLPETALHGDATAYNFSVGSDGRARVYDVGTMRLGFSADGKVNSNGIFDVGRYVQSLASLTGADGKVALAPLEVVRMQKSFMKGYERTGKLTPEMRKAVSFTRADFELAVVRFSKSEAEAKGAMLRLKAILDEK